MSLNVKEYNQEKRIKKLSNLKSPEQKGSNTAPPNPGILYKNSAKHRVPLPTPIPRKMAQ